MLSYVDMLLLLLLLSTQTPPTHCASCPQGQYNIPSGGCAVCPAPEQYSTGGPTTTCSACAPGSKVSGTSCETCTAGKFSSFKGSSTCQDCPPGTGSIAGSSSCTRCNPSAKLANGITALPDCTSACTACVAGRYNDGTTKKCSSCVAGKFSSAIQATSSSTCTPCPAGMTTKPTTTGASACIGCNSSSTLSPLSASYVTNIDTLICAWNCNNGYTRFNYSETSYVASTYTSIGYSTTQALQIFHNRNDFCCEPSDVKTGMYMCGTYPPACAPEQSCTRTSDGNAAACAPVANAHFIDGGSNKFFRCRDWECNDFYFLNKTSGICTAQPTCAAGFTYQRHSITGEYVAQPSGSFTCVPCSRCIDGSDTATPCSQINDTMCKLCSPTEFSYQASTCSPTIPFGFSPVRIGLSTVPVFQGRPSTYSDQSVPITWSSIDFTQGFFLNSFTPCQPVSSPALMFIGGDETCKRMDTSPQSLCALPLCKTQCIPWNGIEGWYKLKTGECSKCIYDSTCTKLQYSDMTTCGPATAPRCVNCPTILLPNSLGWVNPYRTPFPGPYPCDIICRDGFTKSSSNYTCIPCPMLPNNSKITGGCNWTCSLGFVQDRVTCIPCVGVPTSCSIGYYLGYAATTSQCAKCLPCTNLVANSIYVSSGLPNGPDTCGTRCLQGTFVSPGYGFDSFDNPVACDRCGAPVCETGKTFLKPCSYLSDAECVPCSPCPIGSQILNDCTTSSNTTCIACDNALLPTNASWTEPGCVRWECNKGFVQNPNTSTCLKCKLPSDCIASNSYEDDGSGCGRCVACDLFLLLPGQCFNGDGQCGVSYLCDMPGMVTAAFPTLYTTPVVQDIQAASSSSSDTLPIAAAAGEPDTASSDQIVAYASMATLTLDAQPDQLTAAFIADLDNQISTDCACEATIVAVTTQFNITTFCTPTSCVPSNPHRRLLALETHPITVEITLVSNTLLTHPPQKPTCRNHAVLGWQAYQCQAISDPTFVRDRRRLAIYFKRTGAPWVMEPTATSWEQYYLVVGIIILVFAVLLMGGSGTMYYVRVYNVKGVEPEHLKAEYRRKGGQFKPTEREMLLPDSWNKEW